MKRSVSLLVALLSLSTGATALADVPAKGGKAAKGAPAAPATPELSGPSLKVKEIVGTKKEGWLPKVLSTLKRGMSPEEVAAKGFAGAGSISEYGFAEIVMDPPKPGVHSIQLYYSKDKAKGGPWKLISATIRFDESFEFSDILAAVADKYGKAKPADVEKQIVTWVGPRYTTVQLFKGFATGAGYELNAFL